MSDYLTAAQALHSFVAVTSLILEESALISKYSTNLPPDYMVLIALLEYLGAQNSDPYIQVRYFGLIEVN